jgi:hypothetical protein
MQAWKSHSLTSTTKSTTTEEDNSNNIKHNEVEKNYIQKRKRRSSLVPIIDGGQSLLQQLLASEISIPSVLFSNSLPEPTLSSSLNFKHLISPPHGVQTKEADHEADINTKSSRNITLTSTQTHDLEEGCYPVHFHSNTKEDLLGADQSSRKFKRRRSANEILLDLPQVQSQGLASLHPIFSSTRVIQIDSTPTKNNKNIQSTAPVLAPIENHHVSPILIRPTYRDIFQSHSDSEIHSTSLPEQTNSSKMAIKSLLNCH